MSRWESRRLFIPGRYPLSEEHMFCMFVFCHIFALDTPLVMTIRTASRTGNPRTTQTNSAQAPLEYGARRRFCLCSFCVANSDVTCRRSEGYTLSIGSPLWRQHSNWIVECQAAVCRANALHSIHGAFNPRSSLVARTYDMRHSLTSQACHRTILSTRASGYGMCPRSRGVKTLSCSRETASTAMLPFARVPETHTTWPSRRQAGRARDPTSWSFDNRVAFQCEDFEAGPSSHANCLPWPLESLSRRRSRHRRLASFSTTSIGTLSSG
ncbi:hypothetical protein DICSQDRAFT_146721 [Dichomitus squalens LYAD-421 SS1]|uniref:Uncharacterized protein n=2 Tax=Dichomitus squalens TaxID=114155 RepID=A0A4Q9PH49_9APHY|nr:uncharacterized protein DICSQDRAFT_146721 [Dichomitus squalens LYAD-421 SS1]EJF61927.1 hypothetical protein DICSQDRAFT_146721 [Dichomitus squalens LYAD-421 SS1]TBU52701.1 hypothetical protein BD310DRAFT_939668 [Dichomitus squalens]